MRIALWFMGLFAIAVASALFAGSNHGTVTLFLPPHRVDVSLNLFLIVLALGFITLHYAMRALVALMDIPHQARRWRMLQKERAMHSALLDAFAHLGAGRFVRARKAAELALALEESVEHSHERLAHTTRLRIVAHMLAAESTHALQDRSVRDTHFQQALKEAENRDAHDARDGVGLLGARWALDDHDAVLAMQFLEQLPVGASRRTAALRLRFRAARLIGQSQMALETARLLTKHRAFTEVAGTSIARELAIELIRAAHDPVQLQRAWDALNRSEQHIPEVALEAAQRLLQHEGDAVVARHWILPIWERMAQNLEAMTLEQRVRLARVLERSFDTADSAPDAQWLARVEQAQLSNPRDAVLQYLAGVVCMRLGLWGKAQQMLKQSLVFVRDQELRRDAWLALAALAEQRQDTSAATQAYREAAKR